MLSRHFFHMAANNAWANQRLLTACRALTQAEFVAARPSFFGSICATANHTFIVDQFYVDGLQRWFEGGAVNPHSAQFFADEIPHRTVEALLAAQREVDLRLMAVCRGLTDERLLETVPLVRSAGVIREDVPRYLAHLFQHQLHHRGQVHALLSTTSVPPPQLDEFYCAAEAPLRREELIALGTSEVDLWG